MNKNSLVSSQKSHASQLFVICMMLTIYALCYQIQSPLEPYLVQKLVKNSHADNKTLSDNMTDSEQKIIIGQTYAKLKTLFSILQWICGLSFGYLLDRWGIKTGLRITFLCCMASYYLLSISTSIELLYLSKIPGVGIAGYLCSQAAVIKITSPGAERIKWLGLMATSYTIGGTIGPYLGGILGSNGDYYTSAKYASLGSLIAFFLIFLLPDSLNHNIEKIDDSTDQSLKIEKRSIMDKVKIIVSLCSFLLALKFITCIVSGMAHSAAPLILKSFGVKEQTMGKILSAQFAFGGFTNAFLISPLTRFLGGNSRKVIEKCLVLMALVFIVQAIYFSYFTDLNYNVQAFVTLVLFYAIFQHALAISSTSENSATIPKQIQGFLLGIQSSMFAAGWMIGPGVGVKIWQQYSLSFLSLSCAFILGTCSLFGLKYLGITKAKKD